MLGGKTFQRHKDTAEIHILVIQEVELCTGLMFQFGSKATVLQLVLTF